MRLRISIREFVRPSVDPSGTLALKRSETQLIATYRNSYFITLSPSIVFHYIIEIQSNQSIQSIQSRRRLKETREAKERLEGQLAETLRQILDQEENIKSLTKAIDDKEIPIKLSHTRLDTRAKRPNVELCRDAVQVRTVLIDKLIDCNAHFFSVIIKNIGHSPSKRQRQNGFYPKFCVIWSLKWGNVRVSERVSAAERSKQSK